jgi:hypothetical protein
MTIRLVAFITIALLCVLGRPTGQSIRYSDETLHYSFALPDNWQRIPDDVLKDGDAYTPIPRGVSANG